MCCSALQFLAVFCRVLWCGAGSADVCVARVAVCCGDALQCVATFCSVLQTHAVRCFRTLIRTHCNTLQRIFIYKRQTRNIAKDTFAWLCERATTDAL